MPSLQFSLLKPVAETAAMRCLSVMLMRPYCGAFMRPSRPAVKISPDRSVLENEKGPETLACWRGPSLGTRETQSAPERGIPSPLLMPQWNGRRSDTIGVFPEFLEIGMPSRFSYRQALGVRSAVAT